MIIHGDCLEVLKTLEPNSVDTIITDPPYGLSFMGKKWDYDVPSIEVWQECFRVLKPGGSALIFAGSRTQHRMAVNVEDAGFILKDCIMWLYGSGFPKATDISKQLDKRKGWSKSVEFGVSLKKIRERLGLSKKQAFEKCNFAAQTFGGNSWYESGRLPSPDDYKLLKVGLELDGTFDVLFEEAEREVVGKEENWGQKGDVPLSGYKTFNITEPATPEAKLWNGWKSHGLKPAYEPILVAMKPNDGTYANNALAWGVSGLNIDGGRIPCEGGSPSIKIREAERRSGKSASKPGCYDRPLQDRTTFESRTKHRSGEDIGRFPANIILDEDVTDELWSRFFYCAKASKAERNAGCERLGGNKHCTVKPLKLMEYLCTLTKTPTGGIVLDPFAGSGTTGLAAQNTGRDYILIEREEEYIEIIKARLKQKPLL